MVSFADKNVGIVVEIGPGLGILTNELQQNFRDVFSIELEEKFVSFLKKKYEENSHVHIVHADFFQVLRDNFLESLLRGKSEYIIIANLPYHITNHFFRAIFEYKIRPRQIIVMVQKEVALRAVAKSGKHSLLSFFIEWHSMGKILFHVSRGCFFPEPKVDSSVIMLSPFQNVLQTWNVTEDEQKTIFSLVKKGFAHPRKQLRGTIALKEDQKRVINILKTIGKSEMARAEELNVKDWIFLGKKFCAQD